MARKRNDADRFWAKVKTAGDDDCWEWTGSPGRNGYGTFRADGGATTPGRFAYETVNGQISGNDRVDRTCSNRLCCNPKHLRLLPCQEYQPIAPIEDWPHGYGRCYCGCGGETPIANVTSARDGTVRGYHTRWIRGHSRSGDAEGRFWRYVDKSAGADACWEWTGTLSTSGYGRFSPGHSAATQAHRFSYCLANGTSLRDIAAYVICHRCDNPPCVNPAHLFIGTHADNVNDKVAKGRQPRGDGHSLTRVSDHDIAAIRQRRKAGERPVDLAKEYGITPHTISCIVAGRKRKADIGSNP